MTFVFWASLAFLLGFALCIYFDVFGLKNRIKNGFIILFNFILPDGRDGEYKELKINMANAATLIACSVFFIFLISIIFSFSLPYSLWNGENKYTGPLGDLFNGLLTPVLTFLTFCGLLITIMIQNVQMKSTLQELELTRNEMTQTNQAINSQKFDNLLFNLLEHQDKIIRKTIEDGFLENEINYLNNEFNAISSKDFKLKNPEKLTSFFLINYQILKLINKRSSGDKPLISKEEAEDHINILRSLLPQDFLLMIFLNCYDNKYSEYKNMLTKAQFFEHLQFEGVNNSSILYFLQFYDDEIFGDKINYKKLIEKIVNDVADVKSGMVYKNIFEKYKKYRNSLSEISYKNSSKSYYDVTLEIIKKYRKPIEFHEIYPYLNNSDFKDDIYSKDKFNVRKIFRNFDSEANELIKEINNILNSKNNVSNNSIFK